MAPLSWLKRGAGVGKTKRGKGTKLMAVADGAGFPVAISVGSASPHEVKLVEKTLDDRAILNGILWIMRTGAPWHDMPNRYPPYQTCHRRFQEWVKTGTFETILRKLVQDVKERGNLDLTECFIDDTFVMARKGAQGREKPSGARANRKKPKTQDGRGLRRYRRR